MSRIGKMPITLPDGVTATVDEGAVTVRGPKGQLTQALVPSITASVVDGELLFERANDQRQSRANHGLMRSLANNMVTGVSAGFSKQLEIVGIGYRAEVRGSNLVMQLGFSHPIDFPIPSDIDISVDKKGVITVGGIDRQRVGQISAIVRGFRPPDHYKGKGVRYVGEHVRIKAGKSAG